MPTGRTRACDLCGAEYAEGDCLTGRCSRCEYTGLPMPGGGTTVAPPYDPRRCPKCGSTGTLSRCGVGFEHERRCPCGHSWEPQPPAGWCPPGDERLEGIRGRRVKLSWYGRWMVEGERTADSVLDITGPADATPDERYSILEDLDEEDAAFIASAPADIDYLLTLADRQRETIERLLECDCLPNPFSSAACRKCGRHGAESAEDAYANAPDVPLSEERIDEIVSHILERDKKEGGGT
jgi:hypothetical protein